MGAKKCQVCEESQSKYKCPSCLIPYCSVSCFKKHKEVPCTKPEPIAQEIVVEAPSAKLEPLAQEVVGEAPCTKPETSAQEIAEQDKSPNFASHSGSGIQDDKPCYVDDRSVVLQKSQLQSIASSNEIRDALKAEKLQKLIHSIDSSTDADNVLDSAMEDEEFRLFTEKILSTLGN